jgi:hypothetical protein
MTFRYFYLILIAVFLQTFFVPASSQQQSPLELIEGNWDNPSFACNPPLRITVFADRIQFEQHIRTWVQSSSGGKFEVFEDNVVEKVTKMQGNKFDTVIVSTPNKVAFSG